MVSAGDCVALIELDQLLISLKIRFFFPFWGEDKVLTVQADVIQCIAAWLLMQK